MSSNLPFTNYYLSSHSFLVEENDINRRNININESVGLKKSTKRNVRNLIKANSYSNCLITNNTSTGDISLPNRHNIMSQMSEEDRAPDAVMSAEEHLSAPSASATEFRFTPPTNERKPTEFSVPFELIPPSHRSAAAFQKHATKSYGRRVLNDEAANMQREFAQLRTIGLDEHSYAKDSSPATVIQKATPIKEKLKSKRRTRKKKEIAEESSMIHTNIKEQNPQKSSEDKDMDEKPHAASASGGEEIPADKKAPLATKPKRRMKYIIKDAPKEEKIPEFSEATTAITQSTPPPLRRASLRSAIESLSQSANTQRLMSSASPPGETLEKTCSKRKLSQKHLRSDAISVNSLSVQRCTQSTQRVVYSSPSRSFSGSSQLFSGLEFYITGYKLDSPDKISAKLARELYRNIEKHGGHIKEVLEYNKINETASAAKRRKRESLILSQVDPEEETENRLVVISDKLRTTSKYLYSLARGVPPLSLNWVHSCISEGKLHFFREFLLPLGLSNSYTNYKFALSNENNDYKLETAKEHRWKATEVHYNDMNGLEAREFLNPLPVNQRLFHNCTICIISADELFLSDWSCVCRAAGAAIIDSAAQLEAKLKQLINHDTANLISGVRENHNKKLFLLFQTMETVKLLRPELFPLILQSAAALICPQYIVQCLIQQQILPV
jgi:hypothetical protein